MNKNLKTETAGFDFVKAFNSLRNESLIGDFLRGKTDYGIYTEEDHINAFWSCIHDFCGGYYYDCIAGNERAARYYFAPETIDIVASYYHNLSEVVRRKENFGCDSFQFRRYYLKKVICTIIRDRINNNYNGVLDSIEQLEGIIMDAFYYDNIYHDKFNVAFKSIVLSDKYKAKVYAHTIEDEEIRKILLKAIDGHKPDKINYEYLKNIYD